MKKKTVQKLAVLSAAAILFSSIPVFASTVQIPNINLTPDAASSGSSTGVAITGSIFDNDSDSQETDGEISETDVEDLTPQQMRSINMLNYLTVMGTDINNGRKNRVFLDNAYNSLANNIYPNSVDTTTEGRITKMLDTINSYRMIDVKRERLEYIYEQNRAQALRSAIPNPIGILSIAQSGNPLKDIASIIYVSVDSFSGYKNAISTAEQQYIQDGWELEDEETNQLHSSIKDQLSYLFGIVRDYGLPGDYTLNTEAVDDFTDWTNKPDKERTRKIKWLESHEDLYKRFGTYWLELAKEYYNAEKYDKCLDAIGEYENVAGYDLNEGGEDNGKSPIRIFRKDTDYAKVVPMAIISARETMPKKKYADTAEKYCRVIMQNTKDADWRLRYFAAETCLDLYKADGDKAHLEDAYKIAYDNVVVLAEEQKNLNSTYLADVVEKEPAAGTTKQQKKEIKQYNKHIKEQRKTELPPADNALYLNCCLLFALADEL